MTLPWIKRLLSRPNTQQPRQDAPQRVADTSPREEARKFLDAALAAGLVPAEELLHRARKLGHAEKTVRRAKADLGIRAYRVGHGGEQRWFWALIGEPSETAIVVPAEIATQPVAISTVGGPSQGDDLSPDPPAVATGDAANQRPDEKAPCWTPRTGQVPPGFTIPVGVECVSWDLKSAPLKLGRGVSVLNPEDFVKGHLEILAAKLRGDKSWLYDQWPLAALLEDLKDIGIELRIRSEARLTA